MDEMVRQQLIAIMRQYGTSLVDEPRRVEGLLRDLCGEQKREINALMLAAREGVARELRDNPNSGVPPEVLAARLRQRLLDTWPMAEDTAAWAVESWAAALGIALKLVDAPRPVEPSKPTVASDELNQLLTRVRALEEALAKSPQKPPEMLPRADTPVKASPLPIAPPKPAVTLPPAAAPMIISPPPVAPPPARVEPQSPPAATPQPAPEPPKEQTLTLAPGVEMIFVPVPAGSFLMGSDPKMDHEARPEEQPQHRVLLNAFWIGKYPVTNRQYQAFVRAAGQRVPDHWEKGIIPTGMEQHPVVYVSWEDAAAFCRWAGSLPGGQGVRLPSEAEWEKAARGTDGRIYPWGSGVPDAFLCNFDGILYDSSPVGQYSPRGDSPYGCADMAGNVFEWVADWYGANYYGSRAVSNPTGPNSGSLRVLRGGSWDSGAKDMRSSYRLWNYPEVRYYSNGFRCARQLM